MINTTRSRSNYFELVLNRAGLSDIRNARSMLLSYKGRLYYPCRNTDEDEDISFEELKLQLGATFHLMDRMRKLGAAQTEMLDVALHALTMYDAIKGGVDWRRSYKDNHLDLYEHKYGGVYA